MWYFEGVYRIVVFIVLNVIFRSGYGITIFPIETVPNNEKTCYTRIFVSDTDSYNGKVTIEESPICQSIHVTVVADDKKYDKILYYFNDIDTSDCTTGILRNLQVDDNETVCSNNGVLEATENELNLEFSSTDISLTRILKTNTNRSKIELYFTAFHSGRCESYDFQCGNGRCIYHGLSCNGENPCGDNSDCKISIPAIITLCLGCVCILAVVIVVLFFVCKMCSCSTCGRGRRAWAPRKFSPTKALENVQSFTPATVTFVPLKRTWSHK